MLRLSLRTKIMICCIGLVALLDLMVVMFVRSQLVSTLREDSLAKGRTMADNLAARSEHFVLTEGLGSLMQLVSDLKKSDEDVAYAYVTDRKGRVLAHSFVGGFPPDLAGVNTFDPGRELRFETHSKPPPQLIEELGEKVSMLNTFLWFARFPVMRYDNNSETTRLLFTLVMQRTPLTLPYSACLQVQFFLMLPLTW